MENTNAMIPYSDVEKMGGAICSSGLFGIKTKEQAIALMLIAQAEGLHPAIAARDYHIIQGRPSLKADAMLARFQQAGGTIKWNELSDTNASATFSHPQGGTVTIDWNMDRMKKAKISNTDMWSKYPRQMLRSRVVSEGIRTVYPGCVVGVYTPEEVEEFDDPKAAQKARTKPQETPKPTAPSVAANEHIEDAHVVSESESVNHDVNAEGASSELIASLANIAQATSATLSGVFIAENKKTWTPEERKALADAKTARKAELERGQA